MTDTIETKAPQDTKKAIAYDGSAGEKTGHFKAKFKKLKCDDSTSGLSLWFEELDKLNITQGKDLNLLSNIQTLFAMHSSSDSLVLGFFSKETKLIFEIGFFVFEASLKTKSGNKHRFKITYEKYESTTVSVVESRSSNISVSVGNIDVSLNCGQKKPWVMPESNTPKPTKLVHPHFTLEGFSLPPTNGTHLTPLMIRENEVLQDQLNRGVTNRQPESE